MIEWTSHETTAPLAAAGATLRCCAAGASGPGVPPSDARVEVGSACSVGTAVAPDNPFNVTRNSDPNLEPGLSVTDGSFQINGTTIDVNASDSINGVLDRINQSAAGVTATFEAASETVLLTQNTAGATPDLLLENDTSGFLAAVTASYDSASQTVSLNADNTGSQLILSSGTSNFFSSLEISEGTYDPYASIHNTLFGTESNGLFSRLHAGLTAAASDLETEVGSKGLFLNLSI